MANTQFITDLPPDGRNVSFGTFWADLVANPGKWAAYPGSAKSSPSVIATAHSRNGRVFEACRRNGQTYVRCVKP